jgi:nitrite reductase/ring-hydroxylating ferredoxin subunit
MGMSRACVRVLIAVLRVASRVDGRWQLHQPAERLASLASTAIPRQGRSKNAGSCPGHSLHPVLVSLSIGAWSSATALDLTTSGVEWEVLVAIPGVGVDTTAFLSGPKSWIEIGSEEKVGEGELKQFRVDEVALLVIRREGRRAVLGDRCSHLGSPLSEGALEGECVICPRHSSAFSVIDGSVRRGRPPLPSRPCSPQLGGNDPGAPPRRSLASADPV